MLHDKRALWKSIVTNLAVNAVWYTAEYEQFGELQWNRWGDNIIGIIYLIIIWWAFHKINFLNCKCKKNNK